MTENSSQWEETSSRPLIGLVGVKRKCWDRSQRRNIHRTFGHPSLHDPILESWDVNQVMFVAPVLTGLASVTPVGQLSMSQDVFIFCWRLSWYKVRSATVGRVFTLELIIKDTHLSKCKGDGCQTCKIVRRSEVRETRQSASLHFLLLLLLFPLLQPLLLLKQAPVMLRQTDRLGCLTQQISNLWNVQSSWSCTEKHATFKVTVFTHCSLLAPLSTSTSLKCTDLLPWLVFTLYWMV